MIGNTYSTYGNFLVCVWRGDDNIPSNSNLEIGVSMLKCYGNKIAGTGIYAHAEGERTSKLV